MQITVTIDIHELVYDIQNKTYLTGRSRGDGKNYRQVALMQVNNDDENYNQIMRSIGNALAKVKAELSEVLSDNASEGNNTLDVDTATVSLPLQMPGNFNNAATDSIVAAIHHARIYDRILERCAPILFSGKNFREDNAACTKVVARKIITDRK